MTRYLLLLILSVSLHSQAEYLVEPQQFLQQAFPQGVPKAQTVWLNQALKPQVAQIYGEPYPALRIKYWQAQQTQAWILEKVGKERPITFGLLVHNGQLVDSRVLAYRETRGYEIQRDNFRAQFIGARLQQQRLDRTIDGISGATLSVNAYTRVAALALWLSQYVSEQNGQ